MIFEPKGKRLSARRSPFCIVSLIDTEESQLSGQVDGRDITYDFAELDELMLAYATTIHKSQGSEYGCRDPAQYTALSNAAAPPGLHGRDARQALGCSPRAAQGSGDSRQGSADSKALVEAGRVAWAGGDHANAVRRMQSGVSGLRGTGGSNLVRSAKREFAVQSRGRS